MHPFDGFGHDAQFYRAPDPTLKVDETPIGTVKDLLIKSLTPSPDGKHLAYATQRDGKVQLMLDDKRASDSDFEGIAEGGIVFSPAGDRVAYMAGVADKKWSVCVDGKTGKAYDTFAKGSLIFSPDGKRLCAVAELGGKRMVLLDGVEGTAFDDVGNFAFSADGKRWAASTRTDITWKLITDAGDGPAFEKVAAGSPLFSPDGAPLACAAARDGKWFVFLDGQEGKPFDKILPDSCVFSPDGKRFAFVAVRDGSTFAVVDGVEGKPGDGISARRSSAATDSIWRSSDFTATGRRSSPIMAHSEEFDAIVAPPAFSNDGSRLAFAAKQNGQAFAVTDGKRSAAFDEILEPPIISPDGKRVAFIGRRGDQQFAVIDGVEGNGYTAVGRLAFSPDSRHIAFGAQEPDGTHLVVDGQESSAFGGFIHGSVLVFDGNASFNALVFRGDQLLCAHASLQ